VLPNRTHALVAALCLRLAVCYVHLQRG
jgi:hypothetical protein